MRAWAPAHVLRRDCSADGRVQSRTPAFVLQTCARLAVLRDILCGASGAGMGDPSRPGETGCRSGAALHRRLQPRAADLPCALRCLACSGDCKAALRPLQPGAPALQPPRKRHPPEPVATLPSDLSSVRRRTACTQTCKLQHHVTGPEQSARHCVQAQLGRTKTARAFQYS